RCSPLRPAASATSSSRRARSYRSRAVRCWSCVPWPPLRAGGPGEVAGTWCRATLGAGGGWVEVVADLEAPVSPEALFRAVEDLSGYPRWLDMVRRAEPVEPIEGDEGPAWAVELRGRIGPLARSKRLRMVR